MAHLWFHAPDATSWSHRPLVGADAIGNAELSPAATPDGHAWILIGPPTVRVNGRALVGLGIRVLRDRDELVVDGERYFFSTETHAAIVAAPAERALTCPRCTLPILADTPAVACPQCAVWHHQSDEFPCWSYAPECATCRRPTTLEAGWRFDPERL